MQEPASMQDWLMEMRQARNLEAVLADMPYARRIGVSAIHDAQGWCFTLAANDHNVGNVLLQAVHGGVVAAFMETAATLDAMLAVKTARLPKIIDFSIDYLRPAKLKATHARCELLREGSRLANVRVRAWQEDEANPVATARMHFMLDSV
ncbi:PaaI family thioesterase [Halomonas shantousis]